MDFYVVEASHPICSLNLYINHGKTNMYIQQKLYYEITTEPKIDYIDKVPNFLIYCVD